MSAARRVLRGGLGRGVRVARALDGKVGGTLTVLAYHRVAEMSCDPWRMGVSERHFDQHVECLRASGDVVPLADALAPRRRVRRRRRFAVTFDDGYVDNLHTAVAVLERHDVPATIFISTGFTGRPWFWWDRLDRVVLDEKSAIVDIVRAFEAAGVLVQPADDRHELLAALHDRLTVLSPNEIEVVIDTVCDRLGSEPDLDGRPLTADELVTLAAHPLITIGAHSANHRMLTKLDDRAAFDDIELGARALHALLGLSSRVFAYPHGRSDRRIAGLVRRAGFRNAVTTEGRSVSRIDHPLLLPRVNPTDVGGAEFAQWLDAPS